MADSAKTPSDTLGLIHFIWPLEKAAKVNEFCKTVSIDFDCSQTSICDHPLCLKTEIFSEKHASTIFGSETANFYSHYHSSGCLI